MRENLALKQKLEMMKILFEEKEKINFKKFQICQMQF